MPTDRRSADLRHPEPEERGVDVLRRVDAEAVDLEARDPRGVDLREAVQHVRLLGEEVVEAEEVALLEALLAARAEVDVAAVVVVERVVQPLGLLQVAVALEHERDARHRRGLEAREALRGDVSRRVEHLAVAVAVRDVGVGRSAVRQLHDVGRVVDDDVEVDLQPEAVRSGHELREVLVGAEVRVDRREVEAPVAVVGGAAVLDGILLQDRRDPERGEAEILDPLEALGRGPSGRRRGSSPCRSGRSP